MFDEVLDLKFDEILYGEVGKVLNTKPTMPFSDENSKFLNEISNEIMILKNHREYPDLLAFAFWARSSNINSIRKKYGKEIDNRLGLGTVLHITPSNVPTNFIYSFAISFLAGNSNIIRVPSTAYRQIDLFVEAYKRVASKGLFLKIAESNCFLRYGKENDTSRIFSKVVDARVIWGGDKTINLIREMPVLPKAVDISFRNRYSIAVLSSEYVLSMNQRDLELEIDKFYNDIFLFDQFGCSSPSLLFWVGNKSQTLIAKKLFENILKSIIKGKDLNIDPMNAMNKITQLCEFILILRDSKYEIDMDSNSLYIIKINETDYSFIKNLELVPKYGTILELYENNLRDVISVIDEGCQTVISLGFSGNDILEEIKSTGIKGIDRIVGMGQAFDMSTVWDGYDLITELSRKIDFLQ